MSHASEHTNFLGLNVPPEVKLLTKHLKKLNSDTFHQVLKVAVTMLSNSKPSDKTFHELTSDMDRELLMNLYPGIVTILSSALRRHPSKKFKKSDFAKDLKEINIPESNIDAFVQVLFGNDREALEEALLNRRPRFPTVDEFRWRVDVSISTTSLKRVLEPSILCQIKTSDDKESTFEVTKEKFHELRYAVAEVLTHMQQLEKRSILNIEA